MATPSVSFRITRSAEDLATTIHALSQRLVSLEQRLVELEQQLTTPAQEDPEELASLDNVERLLRDCRDLLEEEVGADEQPFGSRSQEPVSQPRDGYPAAA
jgi:predicted  nucleic acid-binding Zn-ribbon protein